MEITAMFFFISVSNFLIEIRGDAEAFKLYDDLLTDYNRVIRPVGNDSDTLTVKLGLRMSQLIDVEWVDYKLKWDPEDYGGVKYLHVPSDAIWLPDIVLYNNAEGNCEITIMTKALVRYDGTVMWKPPAIYKSFCEIDVEYFPFDQQTCMMKFGSWTFDKSTVDLQHMQLEEYDENDRVDYGLDLRDYYLSTEWDIMSVPAKRNEKHYTCCAEIYPDIIFNITIRRKTLFYTVNLIIPCVGISFLSILVFYLPSDSGEKVSLCVNILLSLTVFFLVLVEIIPPTSNSVPLLGKYLLFTMLLVSLSVLVTIAVLNVNFRSPTTHKMAPWVKRVFLETLPKILLMERPKVDSPQEIQFLETGNHITYDSTFLPLNGPWDHEEFEIPPAPLPKYSVQTVANGNLNGSNLAYSTELKMNYNLVQSSSWNLGERKYPIEFDGPIQDIKFIAQHMVNQDRFDLIVEEWKYVAMVLDRLFLWLFAIACIGGSILILCWAPALYDTTLPIDLKYSKIAQNKLKSMGVVIPY
ncbi:acetylcholine receptor subunit alpha-like 1 isoform X2 [Artemia franciscana]|uniref:acetylcholine receptor subunit alpha-like 1 isoform X2 n=1 Tax=Artemia franciscana TaxID=6661 RepID=UPI0032DABD62